MARTPAQNAAIYAARQAKARAEGWSGYSAKRAAMKEAQRFAPGRSRDAVTKREAIAVASRDYEPGSKTLPEIKEEWFDDIVFDFDSAAWYDLLDELSPKGE